MVLFFAKIDFQYVGAIVWKLGEISKVPRFAGGNVDSGVELRSRHEPSGVRFFFGWLKKRDHKEIRFYQLTQGLASIVNRQGNFVLPCHPIERKD